MTSARLLNRISGGAIAVVAIVIAATSFAAQPIIRRLEPLGVVVGQPTVVTMHGDRLSDAVSVLLDRPGLTITDVKAIDNNKVEMTVLADSGTDPGLYPIQLVAKSGVSNLRLIGVGVMPIVKEVEPNSDFDSAQPVDLNSTIEGMIDYEDVDYFKIELTEGQTVHAEAEGLRLCWNMESQIFDPYVAIVDEGKFEVATSDDSSLLQQDALVAFKAPKAGTYKVVIRDSSFTGFNGAYYRLHVGTFPRPVTIFPSGGPAGTVLSATQISMTGEPNGFTSFQVQTQLPADASERFPIATRTEAGVSPSPNWIRVNDLPVTVESEPNNDIATATPQESPNPDQPAAAFCGVLGEQDDLDFFTMQCKAGQKILVTAFARDTLRSPVDTIIHAYGPQKNELAGNDDAAGRPDSYLEFTAAEDGPHCIRIIDSLRRGGPEFAYRIEAVLAKPKLTLDRRELDRDEAIAASVPRGGTMAMMITAKRDQFGGELVLEIPGLPPGVTATTFPMRADQAEIPVFLNAAADAADGAALVSITGRPTDPSVAITGGLNLRHRLLLGQNRVDMWGYDSGRVAVSVADAAPFTIMLHQPGTPIVRDGSKDLRVSIQRNEGFEGEVYLSTLYNPPGIAVNNGQKIETGKTEAMIPITANAGSGLAAWPMAMIARYETGNGQFKMVTNPIQLDVQDILFRFAFPRIAAELKTETSLAVGVEVLRPFAGSGEIELVGLPAGVTSSAPKQPVAPETTTVTFPLTITADAKVGNHKTLHCVARIVSDTGDIIQTQGTGELRIDEPLPPKVDAPAPEATPAPEPVPTETKPEAKPLSRLEQLRQMKK